MQGFSLFKEAILHNSCIAYVSKYVIFFLFDLMLFMFQNNSIQSKLIWSFKTEFSAACLELHFRKCSEKLRHILLYNMNLKIVYAASSKKFNPKKCLLY
jgi:hypothetical protein